MLGKLATSLDMNVEAEARAEDKQWFSGRTGVPCESDSHEKVTPTGYPLHRENRKNGQRKIPVRENTGNLEIWPKHRDLVCLSCTFPVSEVNRYFDICCKNFDFWGGA